MSLVSWFSRSQKEETSHKLKLTNIKPSTHPCPGLSEKDEKRIPKLLMWTAINGGGGRSITKIAEERFGRCFRQLKEREKEEVWAIQRHGHTWQNDHQNLRVYAKECRKEVPRLGGDYVRPCTACQVVLKSHAFKRALHKPMPRPENQIYTNLRYRDRVKGELYGRHIGLKDIIETQVRIKFKHSLHTISSFFA